MDVIFTYSYIEVETPIILVQTDLPFWYSNNLVRTYYGSVGFPRSLVGKASACNAGDLGLIPG